MRAVHGHPDPIACEMEKGGSRNARLQKALAWAKAASRRGRGWEGKKVARS